VTAKKKTKKKMKTKKKKKKKKGLEVNGRAPLAFPSSGP